MKTTKLLRRAIALHRRRAYTEALEIFADLSRRHPDGTAIGTDCAFFGALAAYELRSHAPADFPIATAIRLLERAVRSRPRTPELWVSLGHLQLEAGQATHARDCYLRALELDPTRIKAQAELGYTWLDLGLPHRGRWCVELAARMEASTPGERYHRALARLLLGDWGAWADLEARFELASWQLPEALQGIPHGLGGRQLLYCEQGIGDTLMAVRWVPALRERAEQLAVLVQRGLGRLLAGQWPGVDVYEPDDVLPPVDHWCASLSLPALLQVGPPGGDAYLSRPSAPFGPSGYRVGLVWAGNPSHRNDRRRSTPLAEWAPVLGMSGAEFYSLRVGTGREELAAWPQVVDLGAALRDWGATAAALSEMDLVITVDTAVSHLAGALGIPCWTLLAAAPDWRWGLDTDRTDWYRGHRLFRQERAGTWAGVFARVAEALAQHVPAVGLAAGAAIP